VLPSRYPGAPADAAARLQGLATSYCDIEASVRPGSASSSVQDTKLTADHAALQELAGALTQQVGRLERLG